MKRWTVRRASRPERAAEMDEMGMGAGEMGANKQTNNGRSLNPCLPAWGRAARPKGQDHYPRCADPGAFGLDGNDHLRWRPVSLGIQRGCVCGPTRLLEPGETDRLQSDPRAPEGRDTDRRI